MLIDKALIRKSIPVLLWNCVPVLGVILNQWEPITVFIFYALETVIIGLFNIVKMMVVLSKGLPMQPDESGVPGFGAILFFIVHYYFFVFIQLSLFFGVTDLGTSFGPISAFKYIVSFATIPATSFALFSFIATCIYSFYWDFIHTGLYKRRSVIRQMFEPYPRIFVQQLVVILGAFLYTITGNGWPVLIIFIIIKTIADVIIQDAVLIKLLMDKAKEAPKT